ncbi:MAG: TonB-dependent receptor domain-containing protein [Rubrivivax sp.]
MKTFLIRRPVAWAAAMAALQLGTVHAQTAAPAPAAAPAAAADKAAAEKDGLQLERIVITGTAVARTKMQQSVSVSTLGGEQLERSGAASAAELLRTVPGVRSESSGGEGNANITVRGVPISAGGSRYVQLQEDGLPVILVGDISFATADQFLRADYFTDSVDVIRGGSASTLATNSPGGIINFISKTGKAGGGSIGYTLGVDHRQQRLDFEYGANLGSKLYAQVGGFHRIGEGTRNTDVTTENGGQVRFSLTKEFDGGYVRATVKSLNDRTPTYLPVPVRLTGSTISELPNVDPRTAFFINSNFPADTTVAADGTRVTSNPADGLKVKNTSFGLEAQFKLDGDLTITNRFRVSDISGRFIGLFPAGSAPTDASNGTNRYTGTTPVFSAHIFNTSLDDMGNTFNDLRLQKVMKLAGNDRLTLTGGLFSGTQNVGQTWYWNRYNVELSGNGAKLLNNAGAVTLNPVGDATTTWGGCCYRNIDVKLTATAPYAGLTWDSGPLSVDASVRVDKQRASGSQIFGGTAGWDATRRNKVSYSTDNTAYSVGGNYQLNKDMAVFARISEGGSWASPDRIIWNTSVADGTTPYPMNETRQIEAGLKMRQGTLSTFLTLFSAKTKEDGGFEVTSRRYLKDTYDAKGLEAEFSWRAGDFKLAGGATLTKAEIAATGKKPRRQADVVFQLAPSYTLGGLELGATVIGTTKSYADNDNVVVLPGYTVVNLFAAYELARGLQLQLGVNNLFNTIGYTEAEGQGNLSNNPLYVARSINGRSVKAGLRYSF